MTDQPIVLMTGDDSNTTVPNWCAVIKTFGPGGGEKWSGPLKEEQIAILIEDLHLARLTIRRRKRESSKVTKRKLKSV